MALHPFKRCCRCEHWNDDDSVLRRDDQGHCTLDSPSASSGFPITLASQGCGRWSPAGEILNELAKEFDFPRSERL